MSVTKLPREQGIWIKCDGTTSDQHPAATFNHCPEKLFTANVYVRVNRANAAKEGWGRGLRKDRKRADHCPNRLSNEQQIEVNRKVESEARKTKRDEEHRAAKAAKKAAALEHGHGETGMATAIRTDRDDPEELNFEDVG